MTNHTYDILKSLIHKASATAAYETYLRDSEGCAECQALWTRLKQEDKNDLATLRQLLISHIKEGKIG